MLRKFIDCLFLILLFLGVNINVNAAMDETEYSECQWHTIEDGSQVCLFPSMQNNEEQIEQKKEQF